jgi:hypothetical protein
LLEPVMSQLGDGDVRYGPELRLVLGCGSVWHLGMVAKRSRAVPRHRVYRVRNRPAPAGTATGRL